MFDLSPAEKLQLVEDLWDDLAVAPDKVPVHDWQKAELVRRKEAAAMEVRRGEPVGVEVHSGAAHLKFIARAESEGRAGESVQVRNPATGRVFPATVEAKGKVVVRR